MSSSQLFSKICHQPPPASRILCQDTQRTWGELLETIAGTAKGLPETPGERWLVCLESPFEFAAAIFACWQRGIVPVILPDCLPGTLAQAAEFGRGIFCHQTAEDIALLASPVKRDHLIPDWRKTASRETALELFTSGSTGVRKRIPKTFSQLENEIEVLQGLWGQNAGLRVGTVSHQHIYGLLFRLLWPLATGGQILEATDLFWETVLPKLKVAEHCTLVSSPAHLKHLAQAAAKTAIDWTRIRIFSSGGPLPRQVALDIHKHCGNAPIEVLGSTETGGIAWRQQQADRDTPWTPLPKVEIKVVGGQLNVRSPFLAPDSELQATGDRAMLQPQGKFLLQGRSDRIAKLAEKRVSLTEMESKLNEHPFVALAKLVMLPPRKGQRRDALGCVIQLNTNGIRNWFHEGKPVLIRTLRDHLKPHFEAVTLPRYWRFPKVIPMDSQSKYSAPKLQSLFEDPLSDRARFPSLIQREPIEGGARFHLAVPADLVYLEGHFKQVAVVAGVVQLHWVFEMIAMETGSPLKVAGLEAIKFHRLLFPKETFTLEVQFKKSNGKWVYRSFTDGHKFASGRILIESQGDGQSGGG